MKTNLGTNFKMASQTDLTDEVEIPENILGWTPSINRSLPEFESKRRRSPDKPPLLKQLLLYSSENNEDVKHLEYAVHSMIQRQARKYVCAVEDVILVFKNATERVNACWRGIDCGSSNEFSASNHSDGTDLTEIGRSIVKISEAVKCIQENDALTFWTSQQRSMVLQLLVSTKSAVKLRRKMTRIKGSLEDRVRNVRRVAIRCNCEVRDNSVPGDIYAKWEKEDSFLYNLNRCNNDTDTTATSTSPSPNVSNIKAKINALKKLAMNIVSCIYPTSHSSSSSYISKVETDSSCSSFQSKPSIAFIGPVRVYQVESIMQILHKTNCVYPDKDSICEPVPEMTPSPIATSSVNNVSRAPSLNDNPKVMQLETKDSCVTNQSQKYLETLKTIMSNVAPPQKFNTSEYIYDHCESRLKAILSDDSSGCALVSEISNRNTILSTPSNSNILEDLEVPMESENTSTCMITSNDIESSWSLSNKATTSRLLSNEMQQQISLILEANDVMNDIINKTTWEIREMEREWLSPEKMPKCKKLNKELYQLVDFIVETANMTKDEEILLRIYPEDKEHIISVLDPVLRELTKCFVAMHLLHNLIVEDIQYLKELVSGFPKDGLVIRDWVSDPSMDEDLADMDQTNTATDNDVNVDELFG